MKSGKLISTAGEQSCTYSLEQMTFEADVPSGATSANMPMPLFVETEDGTRHRVSNVSTCLDHGTIKGNFA